ncbi:MAG: hypothetical protein KIT20_04445 [Alphaproteobacteria bacterium]|nr:hypothetical protein [Alphaproteobacteria bacterium]
MKLLSILLAGLLLALNPAAEAGESVRGYTKRDGTYVAPHYRSSPDRSYNNNWTVSPNVNPYTGQMGTRQPTLNDRPPGYGNPYAGGANSYNRRR